MEERRISKEIERFKPDPKIDEIIEKKIDQVLELINEHFKQVYEDFNKAMLHESAAREAFEKENAGMTSILWGLLDGLSQRELALETLLAKNGMDPKELEQEHLAIKKAIKAKGGREEVNISKVFGKREGEIPMPMNTVPQ